MQIIYCLYSYKGATIPFFPKSQNETKPNRTITFLTFQVINCNYQKPYWKYYGFQISSFHNDNYVYTFIIYITAQSL